MAEDDLLKSCVVTSGGVTLRLKLEIVGGSLGSVVLDEAGIKALATMPSLDEMRAKLIGLVNAPATKIAQVVTAPAAKVARVFAAYADKDAA